MPNFLKYPCDDEAARAIKSEYNAFLPTGKHPDTIDSILLRKAGSMVQGGTTTVGSLIEELSTSTTINLATKGIAPIQVLQYDRSEVTTIMDQILNTSEAAAKTCDFVFNHMILCREYQPVRCPTAIAVLEEVINKYMRVGNVFQQTRFEVRTQGKHQFGAVNLNTMRELLKSAEDERGGSEQPLLGPARKSNAGAKVQVSCRKAYDPRSSLEYENLSLSTPTVPDSSTEVDTRRNLYRSLNKVINSIQFAADARYSVHASENLAKRNLRLPGWCDETKDENGSLLDLSSLQFRVTKDGTLPLSGTTGAIEGVSLNVTQFVKTSANLTIAGTIHSRENGGVTIAFVISGGLTEGVHFTASLSVITSVIPLNMRGKITFFSLARRITFRGLPSQVLADQLGSFVKSIEPKRGIMDSFTGMQGSSFWNTARVGGLHLKERSGNDFIPFTTDEIACITSALISDVWGYKTKPANRDEAVAKFWVNMAARVMDNNQDATAAMNFIIIDGRNSVTCYPILTPYAADAVPGTKVSLLFARRILSLTSSFFFMALTSNGSVMPPHMAPDARGILYYPAPTFGSKKHDNSNVSILHQGTHILARRMKLHTEVSPLPRGKSPPIKRLIVPLFHAGKFTKINICGVDVDAMVLTLARVAADLRTGVTGNVAGVLLHVTASWKIPPPSKGGATKARKGETPTGSERVLENIVAVPWLGSKSTHVYVNAHLNDTDINFVGELVHYINLSIE